ncbi:MULTISPECIES: nitrilase-related carbon-nitrogen hydrolase [unclassified Pseudomonas]|uniref:nitrilase-related carbon-nitrogen hydrolase n=1 Tax=unclassified Pseudomonas TaxID=196821 RepID=UPI000BD60FAF|nr:MULTISPECIES: nitrilase-related carbon-nitrogen hydrolase [unclassified Pseudomonas]PVZ13871.1 putative amidohydrolase [Pseudomonas sp. URIL14HWK12:I12]PVZ24177.1 putative amidohydrolase [Pseudomonas sp. URIL14HWK12:I10]PVZ33184.1 putative amidohydrolase [Pseudomonas sp. URIL14HWK12:I11]SNZ10640.1 Predicted amidohydrolase [Pseudomonas sp. URIL14HWK12:I9]
MRKFLIFLSLLLAVAVAGSYGYWAQKREPAHYLADLRVQLAVNEGTPSERGNLLGVQAELFAPDYHDLPRLRLKLHAWLAQARQWGLLNPRTIVVLPEHTGTWLWLRGEKREFYQASHHSEASHWLAATHPLSFAWAWLGAEDTDRSADARLRLKAHHMAHEYMRLFGGLSREFGVTLVAGSVVLPTPVLDQGELRAGSGPLYNVTLVFGPDGQVIGQPVRQVLAGALRGVADSDANASSALFDTPAGRLGVMIGHDSLDTDQARALVAAGAQLLAIPAWVDGDGWPQEHGRWAAAGAALPVPSVGVFLQGRFWDRRNDGQSFVAHDGQVHEAAPGPGARLVNLWL